MDVIFGDLGNDWLVGGTGRDNIYGGWGNDLLNADDDHTGHDNIDNLNETPDTHPTYEDRAFGGAGRDVLIGNTGGDRLIDWVGEYNSYSVPYAPFGMASVSRTMQPALQEFLYALSAGDGADPTRAADTGADPDRNGEPEAELGLVIQKDVAWQDQTGAPSDPQAGNIPGGARDVLRSASFNTPGTPESAAFFADSGSWMVEKGTLGVSAESLRGDAVAVYYIDEVLPTYYEILAKVKTEKPIKGWKANAYIIFDYQSPEDFKFAGINISNDQIEMGHRDASGWHMLEKTPSRLKPDVYYNLKLAVNGTTATLVVNGSEYFSHDFGYRIVDGYEFNLNTGMIGFGSDNSRGVYDNIVVQVLPPEETFRIVDDFGSGDISIIQPDTGTWYLDSKGQMHAEMADGYAVALLPLTVSPASFVEFSTIVKPDGLAGFVFDYYNEGDFKFAGINSTDNTVVIGHYKDGEMTIDTSVDKTIKAGSSYELGISMVGTKVSLTLDGQTVATHLFNALLNDGDVGLMARDGSSLFDSMTIWGDDLDFEIFGHTAEEAEALGFNLTDIAGLTYQNPTFNIIWVVDEEEE
jgi:hypothetical protein